MSGSPKIEIWQYDDLAYIIVEEEGKFKYQWLIIEHDDLIKQIQKVYPTGIYRVLYGKWPTIEDLRRAAHGQKTMFILASS